jgi:hypothetical protein
MISKVLLAWTLVAVTVAVHAGGMASLLRWLRRSPALPTGFWPTAWLLVRVTCTLVVIHLIEIAVWALFFAGVGSLPDLETAFYFSGTTYSTVGYGDVVLKDEWRMFGPLEGLVGILMCGLSSGLFFAVVNKLFSANTRITPDGGRKGVGSGNDE